MKYKPSLRPPVIPPISTTSEEQKEHDDNESEIHSFLQNAWRETCLLNVGAEQLFH
jgi:hypothetical protein